MTDTIRAPWTPEQVENLNRFQQQGGMHPFTCGNDQHGVNVVLMAHRDGWHCSDPGCSYRQDWAHAFMADPDTWPKPFQQLRQAATQATDGAACSCGGRFPIRHLHADEHRPASTDQAEPGTVTDPEYLREQYAAAARTVPLRLGPNAVAMAQRGEAIILNMSEADNLADAVLRVRDRHLQQLRQRLALANAELAQWAAAESADAAAGSYAGRAEEAEQQRDQYAATLREVLGHFVHKGHPGEPCLQTGWISVRTVDRWRAIAYPPKEPTANTPGVAS